jgi:protein-tyrosine phosphatase
LKVTKGKLNVTMPNTLLFVCTGNYYRSRYAEALFNARAPAGLGWIADSRGFKLWSGNVGPMAQPSIQRLASIGITVPEPIRMPLMLREADLAAATRVIALDAEEHPPYVDDLFPGWRAKFEYWDVADLDRVSADDALGRIDDMMPGLFASLR